MCACVVFVQSDTITARERKLLPAPCVMRRNAYACVDRGADGAPAGRRDSDDVMPVWSPAGRRDSVDVMPVWSLTEKVRCTGVGGLRRRGTDGVKG